MVYAELSCTLETTRGIRQSCLLLNFVIDQIMECALRGIRKAGRDLENGRSCELDKTHDLLCLSESMEHAYREPDRIASARNLSGTHFAAKNHNVLLQGWIAVVAKSIFDEEELTIGNRFTYLGSFLTKYGGAALKVVHTYIQGPSAVRYAELPVEPSSYFTEDSRSYTLCLTVLSSAAWLRDMKSAYCRRTSLRGFGSPAFALHH